MLIDKPIQAQEMYCSKVEWPVSRQPRPQNLMCPYVSAAASFLWVRRFQDLMVFGKWGCVFRFCWPVLLPVGKGGFPAHFVSTQLAGLLQSHCLPISPPRQQAGWGPVKHTGQTVVVSFKIKAPSWAHHGTSYPREPAFTVPHLWSKCRHLFFFFFFQAKITMRTFKRKILPKVIFSLDFYLVSCDV